MLSDEVAEMIRHLVGGNLQRERFLKTHLTLLKISSLFFFFSDGSGSQMSFSKDIMRCSQILLESLKSCFVLRRWR